MKNVYFAALISCIVLRSVSLNFSYCCCILEKDKFRGLIKAQHFSYRLEGDDAQVKNIRNHIKEECLDQNGVPSLETIIKYKTGNYKAKLDCNRDCDTLRKDINENFLRNVDKIKMKEVIALKETRNKLKQTMQETNNNTSSLLHLGRSIMSTSRSSITKLSNIKFTTRNQINSNCVNDEHQSTENLGEDPIFNSLFPRTESTDLDLHLVTSSDLNSFDPTRNKNNKITGKISTISSTDFKKDSNDCLKLKSTFQPAYKGNSLEIQKKLNTISIEIDVLSKNKRPLEYIFDRFTFSDELLIKLIRIFTESLDIAVQTYIDCVNDALLSMLAELSCKA